MRCRRIAEVRRIGEVNRIRPDLQMVPLLDIDDARQMHIETEFARPTYVIAAHCAERIRGRRGEGGLIEPWIAGVDSVQDLDWASLIRRFGIAGSVDDAAVVRDGKRPPRCAA